MFLVRSWWWERSIYWPSKLEYSTCIIPEYDFFGSVLCSQDEINYLAILELNSNNARMIEREKYHEIVELLENFPAVAILGPQIGRAHV